MNIDQQQCGILLTLAVRKKRFFIKICVFIEVKVRKTIDDHILKRVCYTIDNFRSFDMGTAS